MTESAELRRINAALAGRDSVTLAAPLVGEQYASHKEAVRALLVHLVDDPTWVAREVAASGFGSVLADRLDQVYGLFTTWKKH